MTRCQCTEPGWCERHQCHKTPHWHRLCQTREDYFGLWEEGRGPGQVGSSASRRRPPPACRLRGEELRLAECPSCGGTAQIKVFACQLHHQCTIGRRVESIACCAGCPDYQDSQSDDTSRV